MHLAIFEEYALMHYLQIHNIETSKTNKLIMHVLYDYFNTK